MTITQQALLTIYTALLEAEAATLTIIDQHENTDTHHTSDQLAAIEGRIERISSILADLRINHTH